RLARRLVFRRDREKRFGGVAIALALEQCLAQPVIGIGHEPVAGIFFQESPKAVLGQRIILVQDIAVGEVVLVFRGRARRQGGDRRGARVARGRRRQRPVRRPGGGRRQHRRSRRRRRLRNGLSGEARQVERRPGRSAAGRADAGGLGPGRAGRRRTSRFRKR